MFGKMARGALGLAGRFPRTTLGLGFVAGGGAVGGVSGMMVGAMKSPFSNDPIGTMNQSTNKGTMVGMGLGAAAFGGMALRAMSRGRFGRMGGGGLARLASNRPL